ncbi:MAG: peptide-methionine (R)-S-oxide reductase MsrB [Chlorobiaceae bacterium]|nr:peptide-methionine (R)-S-oxide reductase MsrB [Chlorobiaceae bacterium]
MKRALFFVALFIAAVFAFRAITRTAVIPTAMSMISTTPAVRPYAPHPYYSRTDTSRVVLPDSVWKRVLPEVVYDVARQGNTERQFTGKYWNHDGNGTYFCAACGNALFRSDAKFAASCGWPSFFEPVRRNSVTYHSDFSYGMVRTEVQCGRCGAHLGHLFEDGPQPTGKRYCMNSAVLDFEPDTGQR